VLLSKLAQKATPAAADTTVTPKTPTLVLSIDQGEELFLAEGQQEARSFLSLLRDLLTAQAPAVIALFSIRSDNYERLQLAKELEGLRQQALSLPPMPRGSYADVIKGPAQRLEGTSRTLRIDDALVDALLADIEAGGAKDALPLLSFTLERLNGEYGATGHLKLEHYEKLGSLGSTLGVAHFDLASCAVQESRRQLRAPAPGLASSLDVFILTYFDALHQVPNVVPIDALG
jgi:hypothetical protein